MNVLFLALSGSRRGATVKESAEVVARGGKATVLINEQSVWRGDTFADGVEVVRLPEIESRHGVQRLEALFVYKGPRFLLYRVVGRRKLRTWARRVGRAYERRIADRFHRRVFLPAYDSLGGRAKRTRLIERQLLSKAQFDLVVVTDPLSIPAAVALLDGRPAAAAPRLVFSIDHVPVKTA